MKTNLARKRIEARPRASAPGAFSLFTGGRPVVGGPGGGGPGGGGPGGGGPGGGGGPAAAPAAAAPAAPAPATLAPSRYSSEDLDAIIDDALANPAMFI